MRYIQNRILSCGVQYVSQKQLRKFEYRQILKKRGITHIEYRLLSIFIYEQKKCFWPSIFEMTYGETKISTAFFYKKKKHPLLADFGLYPLAFGAHCHALKINGIIFTVCCSFFRSISPYPFFRTCV